MSFLRNRRPTMQCHMGRSDANLHQLISFNDFLMRHQ